MSWFNEKLTRIDKMTARSACQRSRSNFETKARDINKNLSFLLTAPARREKMQKKFPSSFSGEKFTSHRGRIV